MKPFLEERRLDGCSRKRHAETDAGGICLMEDAMAADTPGQDPAGEDSRIASLEERIAKAEHVEKVRQGATEQQADDGSRLGNRVLAELIGGLVGGALIGWLVGRYGR